MYLVFVEPRLRTVRAIGYATDPLEDRLCNPVALVRTIRIQNCGFTVKELLRGYPIDECCIFQQLLEKFNGETEIMRERKV